MTRFGGIVWALAIVGALCLTAGAVAIVGTNAARTPAATQDVEMGAEYTIEPWPTADAVATEVSRDLPQPDAGNITVVLAARWGYLNNSVAALLGQWRFNDTRTGGEFRVHGPQPHFHSMEETFTLPADTTPGYCGTRGVRTLRDWIDRWDVWAARATTGAWEETGKETLARQRTGLKPETPARKVKE